MSQNPGMSLAEPWPPSTIDPLADYADPRLAMSLAVRAYLHLYHRIQIEGRENLPATGSFVMISNHTSHLDALCLLCALPISRLHRSFPAAAEDYFCSGFRRWMLSALVNAIPFSRRDHIRQSLGRCRQLLDGPSNVLILFPEGTRSATGQLSMFRPGVGSLVVGTNIPVIPCAIEGALTAFPKGGTIPKPTHLRVVIGQPRRYRSMPAGRQSHHRIAEDLQSAVGDLLCR